MFKKLFEPISIGKLNLKNRLVIGPMEVLYCTENGTVTDRYLKYVEARAKGGWGLIICEAQAVTEDARAFDHCSGMWMDEQIEGASRVAEVAHKQGAKIAVQLIHGGRQTIATGAPVVGPSPIKDPTLVNTPRELTVAEIRDIVSAFGDAALRVKKAGYDAVEIHGAHGYLIQEFTSPYSNKRTDEYGGNLVNRARFPVEIIKDVRKKVGDDFPVIYRMSTTELLPEGEGLTIADSRALARMFEAAGANILHCSVGNYTTIRYMLPPAAVAHGFSVNYAEEIRKAVSVPVITVGRFNDPFIAEATLENNKADMICMARGSLADPEFPNKAKEGKIDDIIHCIGCQGCVSQLYKLEPIKCTVNPITGREGEYVNVPADIKKKVLVIGGGIAGMEAAIAAAGRGYEVTLFEKDDRLGGQWLLAAVPPYKQELATFTVWQKRQLDKLGVKVHLNTAFDEKMIESEKPDAVILATGAIPFIPNIPGIDGDNVYHANDVLSGKKLVGDSVAVIGGGEVGVETASFVASLQSKVAIFEMLDALSPEGESSVNYFQFEYLEKRKVQIFTKTKVVEIKKDAIVYEKEKETYAFKGVKDVVIALGSKPESSLKEKLEGKVKNLVVVGDALKIGQGMEAVEAGFKAGYYI
ncbi:MAG: FAD-dependent oxidoreductase [Clostridiales bacterium]|nr:FAD-dependent oxidoreductase [Clostridiales bacterium]